MSKSLPHVVSLVLAVSMVYILFRIKKMEESVLVMRQQQGMQLSIDDVQSILHSKTGLEDADEDADEDEDEDEVEVEVEEVEEVVAPVAPVAPVVPVVPVAVKEEVPAPPRRARRSTAVEKAAPPAALAAPVIEVAVSS